MSVLGLIGLVGVLVGFIWILASAIGDNLAWGIGIIVIPPLALIYGITRWDELKAPTLLFAAGIAARLAIHFSHHR